MKTLPEIEQAKAVAKTDADRVAVASAERDLHTEFMLLKLDAQVALAQPLDVDARGAALSYIVAHATLYGHSTAEQITLFIEDDDHWFAEFALRAWGVALS